MENQPINLLTLYLDWNMELPVVNETGYEGLACMDLDITADATIDGIFFNVEKVRKSLNKYGFDIVEAERSVDVLVIRER